uniref:Uncharacterized protein n=1 Tax=Parascaris equorum TaxID=6256 RepID=A0A914RI39_PAREQ
MIRILLALLLLHVLRILNVNPPCEFVGWRDSTNTHNIDKYSYPILTIEQFLTPQTVQAFLQVLHMYISERQPAGTAQMAVQQWPLGAPPQINAPPTPNNPSPIY